MASNLKYCFGLAAPEVLDDRAKKITKAFVKLLNKAGVDFAVLGTEESCTGDPAKRSGNEFFISDAGHDKYRSAQCL